MGHGLGERRDEHLRSADFLDAANHPSITFSVEGIKLSGAGVRVTGGLTVRGRTRPVPFDASVSVHDGAEVRLDAEVPVNRADFGMSWNQMGMASMHNTITVHAVFTRA
jgi:polyisoprenoid-binding protein YceI